MRMTWRVSSETGPDLFADLNAVDRNCMELARTATKRFLFQTLKEYSAVGEQQSHHDDAPRLHVHALRTIYRRVEVLAINNVVLQ